MATQVCSQLGKEFITDRIFIMLAVSLLSTILCNFCQHIVPFSEPYNNIALNFYSAFISVAS